MCTLRLFLIFFILMPIYCRKSSYPQIWLHLVHLVKLSYIREQQNKLSFYFLFTVFFFIVFLFVYFIFYIFFYFFFIFYSFLFLFFTVFYFFIFYSLVIKWRFVERVKEQMDAFKEGFNDVVPLSYIQIFDEVRSRA